MVKELSYWRMAAAVTSRGRGLISITLVDIYYIIVELGGDDGALSQK
jgi:hypothetical protein